MLTAGAVLSGIFFGDRCSPMSSSAILVYSLTGTDIYRNIRGMMKTSLVPFLVSCVLYVVLAGGIGATVCLCIFTDKIHSMEQAKRLLREVAETNNAMQSNEIFNLAEEQGISRRTLENAKKELSIRAKRINNSWYWELDKIKPE